MEVVVRTILKHLALSGLVVSFAVLVLQSRTVRETFSRSLSIWRSLTAFGRVAVCLFLLVGVLVGGEKTNGVPPNMNAPLAQMQNGGGSFQTGFTGLTGLPGAGNLVNPVNPVKNNIPVQKHSAQNLFAVWKAANWNVRGAWKDSFWFPFDDGWVFPRGTNHLSGVEVVAQGDVWATPFGDTVASIGFPVEIVRGLTTFSCEHTPSNTYVFAWRDAAVGRDTDNLASASIELFRNGDIATTTNGVVHLRKYVNPFDEDGDGIPDERDPNPGFCDGDFFCTAPALPDGSNQDAYYWLQICATGVMDCARISVVCDGESNLGNYSVIARAGQMASLPLLAGATYDVESDMSFSRSEVSSEYAHIATNSETSLSVSLPLSFGFEQMRGRGSYRFCSYPIDVRPGPVSLSGGCCDVETNSFGFAWNCSGDCSCGGGGHLIDCTASWEGYGHFFGWWGNCPCMPEPEESEEPHGDHGPYLRLDMPNTLFTNNDGGAEASDVVRLVAGGGGMSNGVMTLSCTLPECVKLWRNASRTEEETLPVSWNAEIEPEKTFYLEGAYTAARGSAAMVLGLSGDASCGTLSTNIPLAVYCPVVNVVNAALSDNGELCNPCAIPAGSNACFAVEFEGAHPPQEEIVWSIAEGNARFVGGNTGERVRVASDVPGEIVRLRVRIRLSRCLRHVFRFGLRTREIRGRRSC